MPAELAAVVEKSLCAVLARHQHLEELLSQPDTSADDLARAGKEMSDLAPAVAIALELQKKTKELQDLHALLKGQGQPYNEDNDTKGGKREGGREADEEDEELRAMVWEEIGVVGGEREALLRSAVRRILPRDEADQRGCIVEGSELPLPPTLPPPLRLLAPFPPHSSPLNPCVCASTGGDEAALFETTQNPPLPFSPPYPPIHRHSTHACVQAQEATRQPYLRRLKTRPSPSRPPIRPFIATQPMPQEATRQPYLRRLKTRPSPSRPPIRPFIATQPMRVCKHRRRRGSPICVDSIPAPPPLSSSRPPSPIHRHSTHVCAGTGGDEAALFAADVFQMYQRFCAKRGWQFEVLDVTEIEKGGYKEASASVSGEGVFGSLKWESGVHRVQRVPATEKSGRVHTSAATVAVLPQADEVDVLIRQEDLRIDTYRSGGCGGQSVNTTNSAVRITHLPSGLVVAIQDERSQHMNKAKALKVLRARLFDLQRKQAEASRSQLRHGQIGSGDRSERIRTYNFPQGRITDHRVGLTLHSLPQVLQGEGLEAFIEALEAAAEKEAIDGLAK
ncbi:unnamed protein product, partial [Closterium sp. Naga37s-1]